MSAERLLLDTHALLWWQADSDLLSKKAKSAIDTAHEVLISPISLWEVAMLVAKERVALDRPAQVWSRDILAGAVSLAPLTATAAVDAGTLNDFHGDPADRLIYSTARTERLDLVSKDQRVARYSARHGDVRVIW